MGRRHTSAVERFWLKVDKNGPIPKHRPDLGPCWLWCAGKTKGGYGNFRNEILDNEQAHRFAYRTLRGPIPAGKTLDHLCRVRHCVNPGHVEPVTNVVNVMRGESPPANNARKTRCPAGHLYKGNNLHVDAKTGYRVCKICRSRRSKEQNARRVKKGFRKFPSEQVVKLRQLHGTKRFTQAALARRFKMSTALVSLILNHKIRKAG